MDCKRMSWIAAAALALSGVAAAHDGGWQRGWGDGDRRGDYRAAPDQREGQYRGQYPGRYERYEGRAPSEWRSPAYAYGPRYGYAPAYGYPPAYEARAWHRGERFASGYGQPCGPSEYAHYGLYSPPRGYQWVRSGDDFLLTALATGVIFDVLTHLH